MTKAETILEQLGGNKFLAMTGAYHIYRDGDNTLVMKLPSRKANYLKITLDEGKDLYTMEFSRITGSGIKPVSTHEMVSCEELQNVFTSVTGLETRL